MSSTHARARRNRLRAAGLCTKCGRSPHAPGVLLCQRCRENQRIRERAHYASHLRTLRRHRPGGGAVRTECHVCFDLPHRRGDVETRALECQPDGYRRTGDVCPGCGLAREDPEPAECVSLLTSSAGEWGDG